MAERKLTVYFESSDDIDEDEFFEYVHRFFCKNPNDPDVDNCRLYAMTAQSVVEEEE
ncbi:hypothetical protein SEA_ANNADREAMY_99 [Streptomyces phage Annadreamy]|uniref:Uncharacterized protein n=2 Tax=Annadreamyvirus annadreamy TaxID=2846392 RepID=A0A345GTD7_9CAUD|nr:hypothetical protein HWB75_gp154 [Streptomyces phage Annadreamy]AXG66209.1 hypothetical protein SEA_ANNADREAMY_99 [Streptomyces phage Annadreamy]QGH79433.1 hypothetical protein SEA_LIMPID_108 [Streptomyces phage Limpid]